MIDANSFNTIKKDNKNDKSFLKDFIFGLAIKTLIVVILFLGSLIYIKMGDSNKERFKNIVYNNYLSFAKIYNCYKKYLGDVVPLKNIFKDNTKLVSKEKLSYNSIEKYKNGYILNVSSNYSVISIKSGIVVDIKKDDEYNHLITIQNSSGVNITYGYVDNLNVKIYDYLEEGQVIGVSNEKLYLDFKKGNKYLTYEKYI